MAIAGLIPLDRIKHLKSKAIQALDEAFALSEVETSEKWIALCEADLAQLWAFSHSFAITQVFDGKNGRTLQIVAASGSLSDVNEITQIEEWAKSIQCKRVIFTGRPGWGKSVKGYKPARVTYSKEF